MSTTEEQAVARALQALVTDPIAPSGLADRVERKYRRRRGLGAAGVVVAVLVAIAGIALAPNLLFRSDPRGTSGKVSGGRTSDPAAAISDARFIRTLVLDSGALLVEPPPRGKPATSEQQAIATFRSSSHPSVEIRDVVIGYGVVTVGVKPANVPVVFVHRPAWLVFYQGGQHSCPASDSRAGSGLPEGRPVFVLADTGLDALSYVGRGSFCGQPATGPTVRLAYRYESVPWQEVRRTPTGVTVRYSEPPCGHLEGGYVEGGGGPGFPDARLTLFAAVPMASPPCPQASAQEWHAPAPRSGGPLRHASTGPVAGYVTQLSPTARFDYSRGRGR